MKSVLAAIALLVVVSSVRADVVTVTSSNMNANGWTFYANASSGIINSGTGSGTFVPGPATPPVGSGSARFVVPASQGVELRLKALSGTPLSAITSLSYNTYANVWNGQQLPWLTMWIDVDGNGIYNSTLDDRLRFEPTYSFGGAPSNPEQFQTWQTWNAVGGKWYSDKMGSPSNAGVFTLATYMSTRPNAKLIDDPNQGGGIGGIRIASGYATGESFDTNVDSFTIGTALSTTTYDFETAAVPEAPAFLCGLMVCAVGGAIFGGRRYLDKRAAIAK